MTWTGRAVALVGLVIVVLCVTLVLLHRLVGEPVSDSIVVGIVLLDLGMILGLILLVVGLVVAGTRRLGKPS
jgi:hypothetical protein